MTSVPRAQCLLPPDSLGKEGGFGQLFRCIVASLMTSRRIRPWASRGLRFRSSKGVDPIRLHDATCDRPWSRCNCRFLAFGEESKAWHIRLQPKGAKKAVPRPPLRLEITGDEAWGGSLKAQGVLVVSFLIVFVCKPCVVLHLC